MTINVFSSLSSILQWTVYFRVYRHICLIGFVLSALTDPLRNLNILTYLGLFINLINNQRSNLDYQFFSTFNTF
jgi:hypothetical protein